MSLSALSWCCPMQEFYRLMHEILANHEDGEDDQAKTIEYLWKLAEAEAGPNQEVNAEVLAKVSFVIQQCTLICLGVE